MVINAYKVITKEQKQEIKTDEQIIKELTLNIIKDYDQIISGSKKRELKEVITNQLYNKYHLNDIARINNITQEIIDKIYGYGILQKYIDNGNISDIRAVTYNQIYVKELGKWRKVNQSFTSKEDFEEYVRFCALKNNASINFETPIVIFSDRSNSLRIEAGIEPANVIGPSLVIRIHRKNSGVCLEKLSAEYNLLDKEAYKILKFKVDSMKNIILCGKGGSRKNYFT